MAATKRPGSGRTAKATGAATRARNESAPGARGSTPNKLSVRAYRGDGSVLLAFNFTRTPGVSFRGFAIQCKTPQSQTFWLKNRLSFANKITQATTPDQRNQIATPSNEAPFQKFRWVDFSSWADPGNYTYTVSAMYADSSGTLAPRETASATLALGPYTKGSLEVGFTRAFLSSQAYHDQFQNKPIRPPERSITYDTQPFQKQYAWLGFHARRAMFAYLDEIQSLMQRDASVTVDLFAYDFDEPDLLRRFVAFGHRLRAFLDNAPLHTKQGALEPLVREALVASAGADNVKQGHFHRFAHDKVIVCRKAGAPISVLTGSANFSVRGLYVQANNVLVFRAPSVAEHYGEAFEEAFTNMAEFSRSEIAEGWIELPETRIFRVLRSRSHRTLPPPFPWTVLPRPFAAQRNLCCSR